MALWTRLRRLSRQPLMNWMNSLSNAWHRLKTQLFYRPMFQGIGSGTMIRNPLMIANPQFIRIGRGVSIRDGVRLEVVHHRIGKTPCLSIGDNANLEQNVHIVCHHRVSIGTNVSITANCAIVDVTHPYDDIFSETKIADRICDDDSFVEIGEGSFLGMGAVVLPNVRIGKHVVIGANSVVTKDIPDYAVAAGAPAKILKIYDQANARWVRYSGGDQSGGAS